NPLDRVKESSKGVVFKLGLAEKGDEELSKPAECEGEGSGASTGVGAAEIAEQDDGDNCCGEADVESDRMKAEGRAGNVGHCPGKSAGQAGVAAFGKMAESKERPGERGARSPGVE